MRIEFFYSDKEMLDYLMKFEEVRELVRKKVDSDQQTAEALVRMGYNLDEISDKASEDDTDEEE